MRNLKVLEKVIDKEVHIHSNLNDKKICFIDIETTGLNKSFDTIYLIGLVFFDDSLKNWKIKQLFAEELIEEVDILLEAYNILSKFDVIVNYNGTSFDIPFINNKLFYYKTNLSIDIHLSLDLYKVIKSNKNILPLKNLKLKTIEEYLGIYREDNCTGKECIYFYYDYLVTKNKLTEEKILLHNYEDLYYLLDVINILNILESKKSFIINHNNHDNWFCFDNIHLIKDYLYINGNVKNNNLGKIIYFADNYKVIITKENTFEISLEVIEGMVTPTKKCLFIKALDYGLPKYKYSNDEFNIPKGLILLEVEKRYYIENIKMVISDLIDKFLN